MKNPVLKNVESGQIIEVVTSPFCIGRALTCNYVIENKIVSRSHCKLTKTDEGWTLTDSSTNGTLVNDGHFKDETSPILKHNDEISLGFQSYTYRFLTEIENVPNCQVERLKSQEIGSNAHVPHEVQSSCPSTPNSFDENGISDELLNNLADNMLDNVERQIDNAESRTQLNNRSDKNIVSCSFQTNQEDISIQNLEQPTTSAVGESKTSSDAFHQSEQAPETSEGSQLNIYINNIEEARNTVDIDQQKDNSDENLHSQSNSSACTVLYSLPDELPFEIPQPDICNKEIQDFSVNSASVSAGGINTSCSVANISTAEPNITSKPRDLVAESIEAVVRKYSEDGASASASTSAQGTGMISNISNSGPSTSTTPLPPTSVSLVSPINANKKMKVMKVTSEMLSQLRPVTGQPLPVYTVGAGQRSPVVRMISNNEMQKILANQPGLPIVMVDKFPITCSGASTIGTISTEAQIVGAGSQKVYKNNRIGNTTISSIPVSANQNSASTSGNGGRPITILGGLKSLIKSNRQIITDAKKNILRAVCKYEASNPTISNAAGTSVLVSGNTSLQPAEDPAVPGTLNATGEVAISNTDVMDYLAVPAAAHEVVIENSIETTDYLQVKGDRNQVVPSGNCHESQEPGTSKAPEKLESGGSKQNNQNQFEEMENELMCTICANLFIKAVTLGCSHSFCQYCIGEWKKKKTECPICRNKITSTIRTLVLDNIIEKMLENASEEDKQERNVAVQERKKMEEAEEAKKKEQNSNRNRGTNTGRRGRRNLNRRGNQRNNTNNPPETNNAPPAPVITIVDSPSTTDSDNSENSDYDYNDYYSDEWYNGRAGAYYGGYGRCYSCGERGHWSNGCPFR